MEAFIPSFSGAICIMIAGFAISMLATFATTIYLHRGVAHRSIAFHRAVENFFRTILWLTTGIIVREWVGAHRVHHARGDTKDDPYSPIVSGFWNIQLFNVFYYIRWIKKNPQLISQYTRGIKNDWLDSVFFNHGKTGMLLGTLLAMCLSEYFFPLQGGWWYGFLAAKFHAECYVFFLSSSVNGICHSDKIKIGTWTVLQYGKRPYPNHATTVLPIALLTAGEGNHNYHHAFPNSPRIGDPDDYDPAWPVIQIMENFCWCKPKILIETSLS